MNERPIATKMFLEFVTKDLCNENLEFWLAVRKFKVTFRSKIARSPVESLPLEERLEVVKSAREIYDKFIADDVRSNSFIIIGYW
jgi:hypothetical protein